MNSFFAGIGGFDLAFEKSGFKTAFQCEINRYCQEVLSAHWPGVPRAEDINQVASSDIPDAAVWCGGFPCQDVSVARASDRLGLRGARSGLFFRFAELIEEQHPEAVLLENVTGLLNSNGGRDFRVILDKFKKMGYAFAWRVLNSRYFGVPQSRPRVFMCAWKGNPFKVAHVLFESTGAPSSERLGNPRLGFLTPTGDCERGPIVPKVAFCLAATSGRHTGTDWSRTYITYPDGRVRRMTPIEAELIQGFPANWTVPATDEFGDPDDVDTLRYHAAGNAVSVPVIAWIANRMKDVLTHQVRIADAPSPHRNRLEDGKVLAETVADFRKVAGRKFIELPDLDDNVDLAETFKWPNAGIAWGGSCVAATVQPGPYDPVDSELLSCIEQGEVDDRYFLSPNAAEGILRRVRSQNRKLFGPLHDALVLLAAKKGASTEEVGSTDEADEENQVAMAVSAD